MSKFVICGCSEAVPDIVTELIYNIHKTDIDLVPYTNPIKS